MARHITEACLSSALIHAATEEAAAAAARERRLTVPPDNGQAGFMGALLNGVAGILSEPIR